MDQNEKEKVRQYIPSDFQYKYEDLPDFIDLFYNGKRIPEKTKKMFFDFFFRRYLTDNNFRRKQQGKFIYMVNGEFIGIFDHTKTDEIWYPGIDIMRYEITDTPPELNEYINQQEIIELENIGSKDLTPKIKIKFFLGNNSFGEERLIDTGAHCTTIPFLESWNRETQFYDVSGRNSNKLRYLNDNIKDKDPVNFSTGMGRDERIIITWKNPLIISLGLLTPLKLASCVAPLNINSKSKVIGMDVLAFHNISFNTIPIYNFSQQCFIDKLHVIIQCNASYNATSEQLANLDYMNPEESNSINLPISNIKRNFWNWPFGKNDHIERVEESEVESQNEISKYYEVLQEEFSQKYSKAYAISLFYLFKNRLKTKDEIFEMIQYIPKHLLYIFWNEEIDLKQKKDFCKLYLKPLLQRDSNAINRKTYDFNINDKIITYNLN